MLSRKSLHVQRDPARAVRFPQLAHTLAREHERHPPPFVLLDPVERTPDAVQERSQEKVVRDYGGSSCGKVFFMTSMQPFRGLFDGPTGRTFAGETGRPFLSSFKKLSSILLFSKIHFLYLLASAFILKP